jgi:hypothetical protein
MEAREKQFGRKEIFEAYISQINWDWLFLKGQLIFTAIFLVGFLAFLFWFVF